MDLGLFEVFEEDAAASASNAHSSKHTPDFIQYVPKQKRQKRHVDHNLPHNSINSNDKIDGSSALPVLDVPDDLPVFTNELITKTETGTTLKQVIELQLLYVYYNLSNLLYFCCHSFPLYQ